MALRLSKALGRTLESWLAMQDAYDLWHASKSVRLDRGRTREEMQLRGFLLESELDRYVP